MLKKKEGALYINTKSADAQVSKQWRSRSDTAEYGIWSLDFLSHPVDILDQVIWLAEN